MGALHENLGTFMIIFCWTLLRMRKFSDKNCVYEINTRKFFPGNRAVCVIIWKKAVDLLQVKDKRNTT
jgi:hypothetical protein